jgi:hypothetical protein
MREQRRLQKWRREELKRTPFAILDEPPPELSPMKRPSSRKKASAFAAFTRSIANRASASEGSEHGEENYRYSGGIRICDRTRHRERNHVGSLERLL